jgi:hypothetical protein
MYCSFIMYVFNVYSYGYDSCVINMLVENIFTGKLIAVH